MGTELLYPRDAHLRSFDATVTEVDQARVALDRTAFYPTGGGRPHDAGTHAALTSEVGRARVVEPEPEGEGDRRARLVVLDA